MTAPELKWCEDDLYQAYKTAVHNHGILVSGLLTIAAKCSSAEEINTSLEVGNPTYQKLVDLIVSKLNTPDPRLKIAVDALEKFLSCYASTPYELDKIDIYAHGLKQALAQIRKDSV